MHCLIRFYVRELVTTQWNAVQVRQKFRIGSIGRSAAQVSQGNISKIVLDISYHILYLTFVYNLISFMMLCSMRLSSFQQINQNI